ncbi:MAG: bifunctional phosphopantothenoylcysteine decarboxylase/phosphopantothenate--cysteine ligase CoaBC [Deltaproteobacteria bacterium]|nr:bifunctional phosphopantothenoylcysteine decarboxylase/phosphopantothenate--cysteine ligase CoaBC [Deltaproteobacteria bacterium]
MYTAQGFALGRREEILGRGKEKLVRALEGKLVVLGVSGGISAYRSCELVRLLVKAGAEVQAVLTDSAARFVGPLTFQALCGRPAAVGCGVEMAGAGMQHIDLGRESALVIVAPCTANTLAKLACGLADNLLCTTVLASTCPVLVAPAMNSRMWANPLSQQNARRLERLARFHLVGPASGSLACGEEGTGRMAEPEAIFESAVRLLTSADLAGCKLLVTAGPTREPIDAVRFLSNRSSGRMGLALARQAARRGAEVVLVLGPGELEPPPGVQCVRVGTAAEMATAVRKHARGAQAVLMAAAVADFRPRRRVEGKLKKAAGMPRIELERTDDILAGLGRGKSRPILVGFAAESGDPLEAARSKLERKHCDLIVANDVSLPGAGFEVETNRVHLVDEGGAEALPMMSKDEVAERVLDRVAALIAAAGKRRAR